MCMVLFSAWDRRGGKLFFNVLGWVFWFFWLGFSPPVLPLGDSRGKDQGRFSFQRNLCLRLGRIFRHFLKRHGCDIEEGDWQPVVGDFPAGVVFLAASFRVWILLPSRARQLSKLCSAF